MAASSRQDRSILWLLIIMLIFAPLFRAGNLPLPLMVLELLALSVLLLLFLRAQPLDQVKTSHLGWSAALFLLPVPGLIALPLDTLYSLPGRDFLQSVFSAVGSTDSQWRSLSLVPHNTEAALWALLPPIAVFMAVCSLPRQQVMKLVYIMLGMAVFQSVLSLMQYGGGFGGALYLPNEYGMKAAAGTYLNKDHLAGFLEMTFPVALALLAASVGHTHSLGPRGSRWRERMNFLSTLKGHQAGLYALIGLVVLLALVFTRSRAGIALAMLGLFLVMIAFSRRLGGSNVYGTYGTLFAVIMVLTAEIGLAPILDRFSEDSMEDMRWNIYASTLRGIMDNFPLGAGAGSYPEIYPHYQPASVDAFVNHAHNDYLEWLFDGGVAALLMILSGLLVFARGWLAVWRSGRWRTFRYVQVGAGIGLLLLILHSLIDFNLHKPANAIWFAFLLGLFLHENNEEQEISDKTRKRVRTRRLNTPAVPIPTVSKPRKPITMKDW
ncbi:O-antigen ligase family protein [Thiolapillus sp.]